MNKKHTLLFTFVTLSIVSSCSTNSLTNKLIYSVTCGLDLTINNGIMLQMNYSLNHLAKGGFFVHLNSAL